MNPVPFTSPSEIIGSVMRVADACEEGIGDSSLNDELSYPFLGTVRPCVPTPFREGEDSAMDVGTPWSRVLPESRDGDSLSLWIAL